MSTYIQQQVLKFKFNLLEELKSQLTESELAGYNRIVTFEVKEDKINDIIDLCHRTITRREHGRQNA